MATMVAGKDSYMTVNNMLLAGGTAAAEIALNVSADELDGSVIGLNWKDFLQGQAEATIDASGVWDAGTAATRPDAVLFAMVNAGGTKLFEIMPEGSAANRVKYNGNCFCTKYAVSAARGGVVGFAASFRVAGSVSRTLTS